MPARYTWFVSKNTLVLITDDQEGYGRKLKALDPPDLEILIPGNPQEVQDAIPRATIMLAAPPMAKNYINQAKNVVWMQSTFTGVDAMNDPNLRKDYILTNVRDLYGEAMAEYVFGYILFFKKEIPKNVRHQKDSAWNRRALMTLGGETICILGAGSVGREIAKIAKAFGMHTCGYRTSAKPAEFFDEVFTGDGLKRFLAKSDYVISVLPSTNATNDMINAKTISYMKPTTLFMNIGRGNAVNEDDLIAAIREKKIARAVLDVFKTEPLPKESPLWSLENVYITSHIAGYILSDKVFEIFEENYRRFCAGKELKYRIDFAKGY